MQLLFFVFNQRISIDGYKMLFQNSVDGTQIASDMEIIFKGTKQEFNQLGFSEKHVGGLEIVDNKLVYNQNLYNWHKKPYAYGDKLLEAIEKALNTNPQVEIQLESSLGGFRAAMGKMSNNPITLKNLQAYYVEMNRAGLPIEFQNKINEIIDAWKASVRFIDGAVER